MNLPKRDELSLRVVLALPKASMRIGGDNLILEGSATLERWSFFVLLLVLVASQGADNGEVLDDSLGVDSLASTGLAADDDGLQLAESGESIVSVMTYVVHVWRHILAQWPVDVFVDNFFSQPRQNFL